MALAAMKHRRKKERDRSFFMTDLVLEERATTEPDKFPKGIIGRVQGVALTYNESDSYGTQFAPGCFARSINERLASGNINFFEDHDKRVRKHIGVVRDARDIGNTLVITADIFDTTDGEEALRYVKAVVASGARTGLSVGFIPRAGEWVKDAAGKSTGEWRFTEGEWRETSLTPIPAVPGADVTGVRNDGSDDISSDDDEAELEIALRAILSSLSKERLDTVLPELGWCRKEGTGTETQAQPNDTTGASGETPTGESVNATGEAAGDRSITTTATMDERMTALRQTFAKS